MESARVRHRLSQIPTQLARNLLLTRGFTDGHKQARVILCFAEMFSSKCLEGRFGMPGNSRRVAYYHFPNGTPRPMKILFVLLFANFIGSFAATFWAEHYAQHQPTLTRLFPIHFKGGVVAFVPTWLGNYEYWSFWLHFVFLGICGVALWVYAQKGHAVRVQ